MTSQPPIKIAVMGAGWIGPRHAEAVTQDPAASLFCIIDRNERGIALAVKHATLYYPSVQAMLMSSNTKPDAAILCTPNHTHEALATELLAAGIHVLCEKPLAPDTESGLRLLAAQKPGVHLLTGHHRRFNPFVVAAKRILDSEQSGIGHITAISGLWTLCKPASYFAPPTDWHQREGPVMINLIHDIDVLHYLLGSRIVRVAAFEALKRRDHEAEEGGAVIFHFENGVVGTFVLSDAVASPHAFEMGTGENPDIAWSGWDCYRLFGTAGTLSVPDLVRSFYRQGEERSWRNAMTEVREEVEAWIPEDSRGMEPFALQVRHLVRVVRGEENPVCSGEDGLAAVRVAEAVKKAFHTGVVVAVE